MEEEIFAIKLGKSITIGYEKNGETFIIKDKNQNSMFDYLIRIEDELEINMNDIINYIIEGKINTIETDIKITYIDEIYRIEVLKAKKIYLLEHALMKLFEKIKLIIKNSIGKPLNKLIIIFNNIPYELQLIIHRAAMISKIQIINFIDLNKSIIFFLNYNKSIKNNSNSIAIIKIDEKIEISVFEKNRTKRIFNSIKNNNDINFEKVTLKEEIKGINEVTDENGGMSYIQNYINKLIKSQNGREENINKIFIYKNTENENLNQCCIFGALYSTHFPISKESIIIFDFIDYEENYKLKELTIIDNNYKINKKRMEILFDDEDIPFENCYYKNIVVNFMGDNNTIINNIITIYYNKINFYGLTKDIDNTNSTEFIFFKNFPKIQIGDKYNVEIEEKFEDNQIFKRVNILNVNREKITLNGNPLLLYDSLDSSENKIIEDELNKDILVLVGQNLKILSYFEKNLYYKQSIINDKRKKYLLDLLKDIKIINKASIFDLQKNEKALLNMTLICNNNLNIIRFKNYLTGNINTFNKLDEQLLIDYGQFLIFQKIFYKNHTLDITDFNFKKFSIIFNSLNSFHEKCKKYEKDSFILSKLYNSACNALLDYLEKSYEINQDNLLDLIVFDEDNIYRAANDNNLEFILNLSKKSFIYPYFLQFNSSFNFSQSLVYEDNYIVTCKTSMITLNQMKLDLIKCLPKYGIRIFFDTEYLADTILNTDITIYNEKKIFGDFLSEKELLCCNDIDYTRRVALSFLQKHERFSHYKKYLNKTEKNFIDSPRGIINYEKSSIFILGSIKDMDKGELGESLEYIITNGRRSLIDNLYNLKVKINCKELFDINLFLENNNCNLIQKLKKVEEFIKNKIVTQDINKIKSDDINKQSGKNEDNDFIHKKKIINNTYYDEKDDNNNNIEKINIELENKKMKIIKAYPYRKYTFSKNTTQEYKIVNGKLVPW